MNKQNKMTDNEFDTFLAQFLAENTESLISDSVNDDNDTDLMPQINDWLAQNGDEVDITPLDTDAKNPLPGTVVPISQSNETTSAFLKRVNAVGTLDTSSSSISDDTSFDLWLCNFSTGSIGLDLDTSLVDQSYRLTAQSGAIDTSSLIPTGPAATDLAVSSFAHDFDLQAAETSTPLDMSNPITLDNDPFADFWSLAMAPVLNDHDPINAHHIVQTDSLHLISSAWTTFGDTSLMDESCNDSINLFESFFEEHNHVENHVIQAEKPPASAIGADTSSRSQPDLIDDFLDAPLSEAACSVASRKRPFSTEEIPSPETATKKCRLPVGSRVSCAHASARLNHEKPGITLKKRPLAVDESTAEDGLNVERPLKKPRVKEVKGPLRKVSALSPLNPDYEKQYGPIEERKYKREIRKVGTSHRLMRTRDYAEMYREVVIKCNRKILCPLGEADQAVNTRCIALLKWRERWNAPKSPRAVSEARRKKTLNKILGSKKDNARQKAAQSKKRALPIEISGNGERVTKRARVPLDAKVSTSAEVSTSLDSTPTVVEMKTNTPPKPIYDTQTTSEEEPKERKIERLRVKIITEPLPEPKPLSPLNPEYEKKFGPIEKRQGAQAVRLVAASLWYQMATHHQTRKSLKRVSNSKPRKPPVHQTLDEEFAKELEAAIDANTGTSNEPANISVH